MTFMEDPPDIDLGDGHRLWFTAWSPGPRELNPQYEGIPPEPRYGAIIAHGPTCYSGATFRTPTFEALVARGFGKAEACWRVESWDPLTISPSLLCLTCGDHGFIRAGRWVRA